jgi:hypothetical protein
MRRHIHALVIQNGPLDVVLPLLRQRGVPDYQERDHGNGRCPKLVLFTGVRFPSASERRTRLLVAGFNI